MVGDCQHHGTLCVATIDSDFLLNHKQLLSIHEIHNRFDNYFIVNLFGYVVFYRVVPGQQVFPAVQARD